MGSITGSIVNANSLAGNLSVTGTGNFGGAVTATGGFVGNLTGNVTGNLTGLANGIDSTTLAPKASPTFTGTALFSVLQASSTIIGLGAFQIGTFLQLVESALQTVTGVGIALTVVGTNKLVAANGTYVLTVTPTMAIGGAGTVVILRYQGTGGITIQDDGTLAGSLFQLGAATRALVAESVLCVISDGTFWRELFFKA